jgi:hypothetical protein
VDDELAARYAARLLARHVDHAGRDVQPHAAARDAFQDQRGHEVAGAATQLQHLQSRERRRRRRVVADVPRPAARQLDRQAELVVVVPGRLVEVARVDVLGAVAGGWAGHRRRRVGGVAAGSVPGPEGVPHAAAPRWAALVTGSAVVAAPPG